MPETSGPNLVSQAQEMVERRFAVFALAPWSKKPRAGSHWKFDARLDVEGDGWADATSYGVVPGENYFVLDVDPLNDGDESLRDLESARGPLPPTLSVQTPHGRGVHYYYRTSRPVGNSIGKLAPGLDVKAVGGYVVGPGSHVRCATQSNVCEKDERQPAHGGYYTLLSDADQVADAPDWLLALLHEPRKSPGAARPRPEHRGLIQRGERNHSLTQAAGALLAHGWPLEAAQGAIGVLNEAGLAESLSEAELERTVFRSMQSWERDSPLLSDRPYDPLLLVRGDEVQAPRLDPLVHDDSSVLIGQGTGTLVIGPEAVGKTTLLQRLALCLATGQPLLGFTAEQTSVLYVGIDRPASQSVSFVKLREGYPGTGGALKTYFAPVGDLLNDPMTLRQMACDAEAQVVFIDSLYALVPADQSANDDTWARALARSAAAMTSEGLSLIVAAHPPRSTTDRDKATNAHGSRFQSAGMDNVINLSGKGTVKLSMDKGFGGVEPFQFVIDGETRELRRLGQAVDPETALSTFAVGEETTKKSFAAAMGWDAANPSALARAERALTGLVEQGGVELAQQGRSGGAGGGQPKAWNISVLRRVRVIRTAAVSH